MKIKLKNIGTLKQAEIDLSKDLIILAGPNNTGKTYAAYTVYGVCDLLRKEMKHLVGYNNVPYTDYEFFKKNGYVEINVIYLLDIFLVKLSELVKSNTLPLLVNTFTTNEKMFSLSIIDLNMDKKFIIEYLYKLDISFHQKPVIKTDSLKSINLSKKIGDERIRVDIDFDNNYPQSSIGIDFLFAMADCYDIIFEKIFDLYINNIYINTAERSAINIFSKELSIKRNNIVDQLLELRDSKNGDANQLLGKLQRYPLPIRDSLAISEDLANLSRNKSEFGFLADRIEEVLLDGKITTSKDGEVQYSPNKSKVKNLSIHLTASIVKSLSNLVFYFRHIAQKGDFIIIDEPELNLHPDNQRKVARLFGEIINQGFKVMISTHSDYIIRELNNLIMLKSGGEKAEYLTNKYGYEEKQLIDYQRVEAYLFNHNKNVSLEVTEVGFEVGTIDAVINELNNASEEIYFTLFD